MKRGERPAAWEDYVERRRRLVTPEGIARGLAFQLRPDDVVISPYAKSGTTWLQQIVHGLRSGGDMDFDDISRVVPWIETAHDLGLDLQAEQKAPPRAFKSHLSWHAIPKGGRYIVSLRDPRDVLVSYFRFMEGWLFEPGSISLEELARKQFLDRGEGTDYWTHLASWWPRRSDEQVLLLAFELMKEDLPANVRRIASFLDIDLDQELLDLVVRQSSLSFMLEHRDRFDDLLMRQHSETVAGLPPGSDSAKVRRGQVGEHLEELSSQLIAELDRMWLSAIGDELGLGSYDALLDELRRDSIATRPA